MNEIAEKTEKKVWYKRHLPLLLKIGVAFLFLTIVGPQILYFCNFHGEFADKADAWGQYGDFIGGITNPIIALFNIVVLAYLTITIHNNEKERHAEAVAEEKRRSNKSIRNQQSMAIKADNYERARIRMADSFERARMKEAAQLEEKRMEKAALLEDERAKAGIEIQKMIAINQFRQDAFSQLKTIFNNFDQFPESFAKMSDSYNDIYSILTDYDHYNGYLFEGEAYSNAIDRLCASSLEMGRITKDFKNYTDSPLETYRYDSVNDAKTWRTPYQLMMIHFNLAKGDLIKAIQDIILGKTEVTSTN